jgi:hypothetical protein
MYHVVFILLVCLKEKESGTLYLHQFLQVLSISRAQGRAGFQDFFKMRLAPGIVIVMRINV